ncbi:MAG: FAD-binding oxidoreductase [Alphaproteobacteria bacterium]
MTPPPADAAPADRRSFDRDAFIAALDGVPVITDPALVKQKSRDFFWYSPILKKALRGKYADLVVTPRSEAEVLTVARACVQHRVPLTARGAGTGNYGQAMPLEGGVILELTGLDRIKSLSAAGVLTVEAGKRLIDLESETLPEGWELRMFPSTRRTATIGGYIAGGSSGIGSINYGLLRDRGSVLGLRVVTMEDSPSVLELRGDDVMKAVHAYGCNGIITELELPLAPAYPWADMLVTFVGFSPALHFGHALATSDAIVKKLITPIAAPVPQDYFRPLKGVVPDGHSIVICMIAEGSLQPFESLVAEHGGEIRYAKRAAEMDGVVPLYEYTWNHTTLQALKVDKGVTYLQTLFPPRVHLEKIEHMVARFGDELPMHCEFVRLDGEIGCFGLQLVRYSTPERLQEIIDYHEAQGCPIFNPHTYILEDGGMKQIDEAQLAFKRHADPHGLLNPGKMRAWWERPTG